MTTHQLEALITLAEALNYTKASKLLHMTQPNLSRIIFSLEQEIGVKLFMRSKRDVALTTAGKVFYDDSLMMMSQYKSAVARAKQVDTGTKGVIDLGYLGPAMLARLPDIITDFKRTNPDIIVNIWEFSYTPLIRALENNEIDIAFTPEKGLLSVSGIEKRRLFSDEMCLIVNSEHSLADRTVVDFPELSDESFIMIDPKISSMDFDMLWSMCQDRDFIPKDIFLANSLNNLIMMVSCGYGISILAGHMRQFTDSNIHFISLPGYENYFEISCAWRVGLNASVPFMLETLRI
jgi:DNA-binding transcriptional LysR family regulator